MKPHPRIRKTIKWGGAVVTVLLVVVWIASRWWMFGWAGPNDYRLAARGALMVAHVTTSGLGGGWGARRMRPELHWWIQWFDDADGWTLILPLWFPPALALIPTLVAWRLDVVAGRRQQARLNLCPKCHYDRAGLAAGAVCPECGSKGGPA
jgi:hypothetical protein